MDQKKTPITHVFMSKYRQGSGHWKKPSDGMAKPRIFIRPSKKPKGKDIYKLLDKADKWVMAKT